MCNHNKSVSSQADERWMLSKENVNLVLWSLGMSAPAQTLAQELQYPNPNPKVCVKCIYKYLKIRNEVCVQTELKALKWVYRCLAGACSVHTRLKSLLGEAAAAAAGWNWSLNRIKELSPHLSVCLSVWLFLSCRIQNQSVALSAESLPIHNMCPLKPSAVCCLHHSDIS